MSDVKIGQLITGDAQRDAIHVAIAPVVAGETLLAGQHVRIDGAGKCYRCVEGTAAKECFHIKTIGIVDPYLTVRVLPGERFYLFLYPNTVTSLRHEWTHPAFGPESEEAARERLQAFAVSLRRGQRDEERDADWVISTLRDTLKGDSYVGDYDDQAAFNGQSDALWNDYEIVTGDRVPREKREDVYFSCNC